MIKLYAEEIERKTRVIYVPAECAAHATSRDADTAPIVCELR